MGKGSKEAYRSIGGGREFWRFSAVGIRKTGVTGRAEEYSVFSAYCAACKADFGTECNTGYGIDLYGD